MPLPLVPIISALAAGGTLVPHAAGGLIVSSAGGYVVGTYISTAAVSAILTGGITAIGAGAAVVSGAAAAVIGGAGIFGTTIGASGITGVLMSAGIIASTPVWVPVAIAGAGAGLGLGAFKYYQLHKKLNANLEGKEAQFTDSEAKVIEYAIRRLSKRSGPLDEASPVVPADR